MWIRRAAWTSPEPLGLWGQERAVEALDRLVGAIQRGGHPRHLDMVRNNGIATSAVEVAGALARRMDDAHVQVAPHPTEAALRGVGVRGLLARADRSALVLDAHDLVADRARLGAVIEAIVHGATTELPATPGAATVTHACAASIVLIGSDGARKALRDQDARFDQLWDERVTLRSDLPRAPTEAAPVVALLQRIAQDGHLGDVSLGAYAFVMEQLAGRPARRDRVALDPNLARRILTEARLSRGDEERLRSSDVEAAWARLQWRGGTQEAAHRARLRRDQLQMATTGEAVGVVNGLMVYGSGASSYSIPGRITARVSVGRHGIVNIEREARYSGRSFDKGVFQLGSWLSATFAPESHPLAVSASLVFEQNYGKVDGDSATLAEAVALLSALSGLPARQDVAMTGAMNQRGELIAVGSLNLKIAGWWRTCRDRGDLTGQQGVLIPEASVGDLQVDREVVADIAAGRFHVWVASSIGEAVELGLGRPAGVAEEPDADTVFGRASRRLRSMSDRLYPPRKPPAPPAPRSGSSGNGDGKGA